MIRPNIEPSAGVTQSYSLMRLDRRELSSIFRDLPAPSVPSMHGEYRATLLDQGRWANNLSTLMAFNLPGVWVAKAFRPLDDERGEGYNGFRIGTRYLQRYRMDTYIGPSQFDGRPSYHLDYRTKNRLNLASASHLKGEVRQLSEQLFLGLGTADFRLKPLRRACPFILEGPVGKFEG